MTQTISRVDSKVVDLVAYRLYRDSHRDSESKDDDLHTDQSERKNSSSVLHPGLDRDLLADVKPIRVDSSTSADLLQFNEMLEFEASIEIDNLDQIGIRFSPDIREQVLCDVDKILSDEFGGKRIKRKGFLFSTQHSDIDSLIARLLRVQFYAKQISLPQLEPGSAPMSDSCVTLTWGVGRTVEEAFGERLKRGMQKKLRSQTRETMTKSFLDIPENAV